MVNGDELLFCVNENNKPIVPQPRKIVHATGIWHRTSHIWVVNNKVEILCQKRSLLKDKAPGLWEGFFGGHIPPNISYLEHAITELNEEIGLSISDKDLKQAFVYKLDKGKEFVGVFILKWNGDETTLKLEEDEVDQVRWFTKSELMNNLDKNDGKWSIMGYEDKLFELI